MDRGSRRHEAASVAWPRRTIDQRERDISNVESNLLGELARNDRLHGRTDQAMLDGAESYSKSECGS